MHDTVFVTCLLFSSDNSTIAADADNGTVQLWDLTNGNLSESKILQGHTTRIISFSPDSRILVSGSNDNTVRVWDTMSRKWVTQILRDILDISPVSFSSNGYITASGSSADGTIHVWGLGNRSILGTFKVDTKLASVSFFPDRYPDSTIAIGTSKAVMLWDWRTGLRRNYMTVRVIRIISFVFHSLPMVLPLLSAQLKEQIK
ncbi:hypothetical protein M422DRAFT_150829 [Sphaerobolus stellatus SS14]|nr:hypothetical protein M422DRAFT_150829 [Sphaerobolus stellatus SS14]